MLVVFVVGVVDVVVVVKVTVFLDVVGSVVISVTMAVI